MKVSSQLANHCINYKNELQYIYDLNYYFYFYKYDIIFQMCRLGMFFLI